MQIDKLELNCTHADHYLFGIFAIQQIKWGLCNPTTNRSSYFYRQVTYELLFYLKSIFCQYLVPVCQRKQVLSCAHGRSLFLLSEYQFLEMVGYIMTLSIFVRFKTMPHKKPTKGF